MSWDTDCDAGTIALGRMVRGPRSRAVGHGLGSSSGGRGREGFLGRVVSGIDEQQLGGLVLIAPATDFTERLMWPRLPRTVRDAIGREGVAHLPSDYGEPYPVTRRLFEDGRNHLLYDDAPIATGCPVHILQGVQDPDVPHTHAIELVERLAQDDVVLTLVKDGDHRLSRDEDIARLIAAVEGMARAGAFPRAEP